MSFIFIGFGALLHRFTTTSRHLCGARRTEPFSNSKQPGNRRSPGRNETNYKTNKSKNVRHFFWGIFIDCNSSTMN